MKVDMSPRAVKGRLKLVGQLWRLGIRLGTANKKTDTRSRTKNASEKSEIAEGRNNEKILS